MAVPGLLYGAKLGPFFQLDRLGSAGATSYAMAALNTGFCARFVATQNKDIASVKVNWAAVTAAGVVECRIETVDATTGKPTGTLYDANATVSAAPTVNWQTFTFASVPTTNLTVGTQYAVVLLTTTAGTTQTLRAYPSADGAYTGYPLIALTAADGTTRSNFAEVASTLPIVSFLLDDATEDPMGFIPYVPASATVVHGTIGAGLKITTAGTTLVAGIDARLQSVGTPAGDLRVRILDSGDSVVANSTYTMDKDSGISGLAGGGRNVEFMFGGLVSLAAGTYRVVLDSASSANSSNCWSFICSTPVTTTVSPASYVKTSCPDVGTPSWTDSATADQPPIRLIVDSITAGSGGNANLMHGKIQ